MPGASHQGLVNHGRGWLPLFLNKVLLELYWNISTPIILCVVYVCFYSTKAELTSFNTDSMAHQYLNKRFTF